jgi:hypothetical protein
MTCEECLSYLAAGSLREISPDSPVLAHCATCPDCSRVTTALRDREYEAATLLNSLPPMANPLTIAETAVITARRRRIGGVVVMITGTALAITIWIAAATTIIPALNRADVRNASLRTETIQLRCLSPAQAGDVINPYVRSHGSTYYLPSSGISVITVRATPRELSRARDLIAQFEGDPGAACHLPAATTAPTADKAAPAPRIP